ncbi:MULTISPECIES: hypothetical protein [unclassified Paenibacillus]|uniref:hypothetical protein n=1 Tax=unclassified Paenibacillus TaxID=185978 RepID=UPI001AEA625F|nr:MULTISPECIES: hypothetical protein [unclassified Paenibacillus]MBP1155413.1 hypothetical protein [Paenibacillus sp. PvP091]MBP1169202.1 hypothetical protein [Paenibacillus sp. PvR098]MBP2440230.1 hypothetical protein [Paenibacillus sp. PvP052]
MEILEEELQTDSTETITEAEEQQGTPIPAEQHETILERDESAHQQQDVTKEATVTDQAELQEQETKTNEMRLMIDDIVKPGKFGVTNSQMTPAISEGTVKLIS